MFALAPRVIFRSRPDRDAPEVGTLALGGSVPVAPGESRRGGGCARWTRVLPEGWVCEDATTTRDPAHPVVVAARDAAGRYEQAAPHRYGESLEAPLYRRLPTAAEQRRAEPDLARRAPALEQARAALEAGDAELAARIGQRLRGAWLEAPRAAAPEWLADARDSPFASLVEPGVRRARATLVPQRSTLAVGAVLTHEGRAFGITPELWLVPLDRLVEQRPSTFRGVPLDGVTHKLPLGFVRAEDRPRFRRAASATVPASLGAAGDSTVLASPPEPAAQPWPRLSALVLTGRRFTHRARAYLEVEGGDLIDERDATVVRAEAPRGFPLAEGERWIDVSIFHGTLVAYEGTRPVFATLISPGLYGYRREGGRQAKHTTPVGAFRIEWKHRSTTMSPDPQRRSYSVAEVPWTQFFQMPFALHAAYWHDRFGEPRSGGCVNLSVEDARWLFGWTSPTLPEGWHGVRAGGARGDGTWVRVR